MAWGCQPADLMWLRRLRVECVGHSRPAAGAGSLLPGAAYEPGKTGSLGRTGQIQRVGDLIVVVA
jgi:hypothetical protein